LESLSTADLAAVEIGTVTTKEVKLELVELGEVIHVIERRIFSGDVRRHFVGEIEACTNWALRVRGYLFVYDSGASAFLRKPEIRTRVIPLDNRVIINVLPDGVSFDSVSYTHDAEGNLTLKDEANFELDVSEFSAKE
jgi:hypothetical protein